MVRFKVWRINRRVNPPYIEAKITSEKKEKRKLHKNYITVE